MKLIVLLAILLQSSASLAIDALPASDRLKSCDPKIALAAANEIVHGPRMLEEPLETFPAAFILYQNGKKDDAVFWFYAAQLRSRYQLAFINGDRGQLLSVMMMTVGTPINNYAFQDTKNLNRILDRVLKWDETTANPLRDQPHPEGADTKIAAVYAGLHDLKATLTSQKETLESKAKEAAPQIQQMYGNLKPPVCKVGELDPAYTNQVMKAENTQIVEFVRNLPEVAKLPGNKQINVASYKQTNSSALPSRYTVSITANNKTVYAEVDVARVGLDASFTLACLTPLWIGQRDAFKDVCVQ